jgi:hypothetical protein
MSVKSIWRAIEKTDLHRVNEKPTLVNSVLVKKEDCPSKSLSEKISSQSCDPFEYGEPGGRLENEQGNSLLEEKTYYYGWPIFESGFILQEEIFQFTKVFQPDSWR